MNDYAVLAVVTIAAALGGALGARLAYAPAWKGAFVTIAASIIQIAIGQMANIQNALVYSLIFVLAAGLVGGRFGLNMKVRQIVQVLLGGFLFSLLAGVGALYLFGSPTPI